MADQKEEDKLAFPISLTTLQKSTGSFSNAKISDITSTTTAETTSPLYQGNMAPTVTTTTNIRIEEPEDNQDTIIQHEYDTEDPVVLSEIIKECIETHTDEYKNENKTNMDVLHKQICKDLNCDSNEFRYMQTRVKTIMHEIYRQKGIEIHKASISPNVFEVYDQKDIDLEIKRFQSQKTLVKCDKKEMEKIKKEFKSKMYQLLSTMQTNDMQIKEVLREQCTDESCTIQWKQPNEKHILTQCPCLQRVCVFLDIYHKFRHTLYGVNAVNLVDCFQINDTYNSLALQNDFQHVHMQHIVGDHQMQQLICKAIADKYPCKSSKFDCYYKIRHYKYGRIKYKLIVSEDMVSTDFTNTSKNNNKNDLSEISPLNSIVSNFVEANSTDMVDIAFSQLIDNIHCYFLHSDVQYGCHFDEYVSQQKNMNEQKKNELINTNDLIEETKSDELFEEADDEKEQLKVSHVKYIGREADKKWIQSIDRLNFKHASERKRAEKQQYEKLVKKMGIYRWQGTHSRGCISGTGLQDLAHVKPRYKTAKEEALKNIYHPLSIENWNQTVTKVIQFKKSFGVERIRTTRDGKYYDVTMETEAQWKKGETPTMKEITVIKLYTDWDELQSELKKCFRLESVEDIVKRYSPATEKTLSIPVATVHLQPQLSQLNTKSTHMLKASKTSSVSLEEAVDNLKFRISQFFHWRAGLLIFINKFSQLILPTVNDKEFILYHGVNKKMILNPSSTTSYFGPLSTSASYYVAQTFATDCGMILALSSQYPKASLCNAFNASIISDYPEEQEYLIGHIYLRIRRVYTKPFLVLPLDSKLKNAFFVLHLFREQIFSMNSTLESYLIPFIQVHLKDVRKVEDKWLINEMKANDKTLKQNYKYLQKIYNWGQKDFPNNQTPKSPDTIKINNSDEEIKKSKLFYIMIKKFNEFVTRRKLKQILKLDCISPGLRPYFLKKSEKKYKLKKRYNGLQEEVEQDWYEVSFDKVIKLFPNTEAIQFFNWYAFDDNALKRLIVQIEKKSKNKLKAVKFVYYDYNNELNEHPWFFDPEKLNKSTLNILDKYWTRHMKQEKIGFSIKLKQK